VDASIIATLRLRRRAEGISKYVYVEEERRNLAAAAGPQPLAVDIKMLHATVAV
jgi:hypothetical protein